MLEPARRAGSATARGPARRRRCASPAACSSAPRSARCSAYLAQRVLGQYELAARSTRERARAAAVRRRPTSTAAARGLEVDRGELLTWVALHEVTHAVQFSSRAVAARPPRAGCCASCSPRWTSSVDPRALLRLPGRRGRCAALVDAGARGRPGRRRAGRRAPGPARPRPGDDGAGRGPRRARHGRRRARGRCPTLAGAARRAGPPPPRAPAAAARCSSGCSASR